MYRVVKSRAVFKLIQNCVTLCERALLLHRALGEERARAGAGTVALGIEARAWLGGPWQLAIVVVETGAALPTAVVFDVVV